MAYIKRIVDGAIFEVFGTTNPQHRDYREVDQSTTTHFFIFDAKATEDADGNLCDGVWVWKLCTDFLPLEELVPEDEEEDEDEGDDNELHLPTQPEPGPDRTVAKGGWPPPKEDKL